jgi:nucleoside-diphosphate-sugar epimerase
MAITENTHPTKILVAGCGKLGGRIAQALVGRAQVFGLRRDIRRIPSGVTGIAADLSRPGSLRPALPDALDVVIYCLTPSQYDEAGYRTAYVTGLRNLIDALGSRPLTRLLFISSTSVYAQHHDEWVDESSATEPRSFSGQQILAGEQLALGSGHPATVVRFSGIYGPTRTRFLEEVRQGRVAPVSPAPFSNRIHEEDAVRVVTHLTAQALNGQALAPVYLASDSEPARLDEVVAWLRRQVPCRPPAEDARQGGRGGSKRCDNRRLRESGFEFRYPNYRAGYRQVIDSLS